MPNLQNCAAGNGNQRPLSPPPPQPMMRHQPRQQSPTEFMGMGGGGNSMTSDEKLLDLTNKTKYNLVQRNGQRIYGGPPPGWEGAPPEKGCEIFVGKVPRDCYEDELVPIFASVSSCSFPFKSS